MKDESFESKAEKFVKNISHGKAKLKDIREFKKEDAKIKPFKNQLFRPHGVTDPSYNCPDCFGEGLKDGFDQYNQCPRCRGTGKIGVFITN